MLKLPEELRGELAKPQGKLYKDGEGVFERVEELNRAKIAAFVGDVVTALALKSGTRVDVAVVDGKTLREEGVELKLSDFEILKAKNPPGAVSCELVAALERAVELAVSGAKVCVWVEGEEDLAALPLALLLPEGSIVIYGQPREGVVVVEIDGEKKLQILNFARRMERVGNCEEIDRLLRW
ncbi:MAG: DUF359 domain-containing protein [Archaeoglobaceae archaeon]